MIKFKTMLGLTVLIICVIYSSLIIAGVTKIFTITSLKTQAIILVACGALSIILSIFTIKIYALKIGLFISGIFLFDYTAKIYWQNLPEAVKILAFVFFAIQIILVLNQFYPKAKNLIKPKSKLGTPNQNTKMNVVEYCKSKFADDELVNSCVSKITNGDGR